MTKKIPVKLRRIAIDWLENNQRNGAFVGHPEHDMNFERLPDDEIQWYLDNWIFGIKGDKFIYSRPIAKEMNQEEVIDYDDTQI